MSEIRLVQEDGRVFIDMATQADNPCLHCGQCCSSFRISMYFGETTAHGGAVPVDLTTRVNDFFVCMKGTEEGRDRCVALQGSPEDGTIRCGIYESRPTPCREYPVWLDDGTPNPKCNALRAKAGIAPITPRRQL